MTKSYTTTLSWFGLAIVASLMLYHTSDRVAALGRQLREINAQIEAEQESLHVLKAEWVYLSNPARVEAVARRHLDLQPTAPKRVVSLRDIDALVPLHDGIAPAPQTQIAQITDAFAPQQPAPPLPAARAAVPDSPPATQKTRLAAAQHPRHINEHMVIQHSMAAQTSTDGIGALIRTLSLHP